MSYSYAVPQSRSGGGGFSHFLLLMVLLAIVGSTLVVMLSHVTQRHGEEFVKAVSSQCDESNYQHHFYRESDDRHAYLCFLEKYSFVFTIKNFDPAQIEVAPNLATQATIETGVPLPAGSCPVYCYEIHPKFPKMRKYIMRATFIRLSPQSMLPRTPRGSIVVYGLICRILSFKTAGSGAA